MELNFEGLEMQLLNIPSDRDQRVHEKKGSFTYLSCLLPKYFSVPERSFGVPFVRYSGKLLNNC